MAELTIDGITETNVTIRPSVFENPLNPDTHTVVKFYTPFAEELEVRMVEGHFEIRYFCTDPKNEFDGGWIHLDNGEFT